MQLPHPPEHLCSGFLFFMSKKVLEVSETEFISLHLDTLIVRKHGARVTLPLKTLDTILITNPYCNISVPLLNKIVENNINLIVCNTKFQPTMQILPISSYYSNKNYLWQIRWTDEQKNQIWKQLVKLKIINYARLINHLNITTDDNIEKLTNYYTNVVDGDLNNCEGHAAKLSFKLLYGEDFSRSQKDDIINKYLNYGYIVLMTYVSRTLIKNGLDNRIGIFHKSFNNHFALSCDIMEPFRPIIDYLTFSYLIKNQNDDFKSYKKDLFISFENFIFPNGKNLNQVIDMLVKAIINNKINERDFNIDWS
ncbi:CRISPR-associated protein Cas1 [Mycoplasmoides gallisepticum CA06_2006.052-5-2P]|uniref:CRISPR-associated endonuclease Cas1 n=1 Tax=Mycoplasmoides gallisepticum WI01_2001.043-13-2P TaxID=1159201 RepID=J3VHK3_MYCGL|nr:type II CRISPR-associated endonuclease Cas1 [Mycoplasmoides gallisepticum]AFP76235.1 CRISPR-associated protein Cas1 [Mycoplasmoides gallisepticum VA94_7994-1-7P]AFP77003.1 CRISPR-associated protein Cas1 [Mycoplasmoides gallisepticum NC95_13295-2-2P]AFP78527.1 CRISPR-associated protein Cas1 [Mycoplasmoides gallisepticum NY01_2001.047-5-1P]AFP80777.1 CRISPR-associated protein Cas1 [Mycoplasmoides gallisepticum CA06_2006.052-5-2P]AFP77761.1 CRISPR-associated protein Cas1 [Mycoplasmoides gallis